MNPDNEDPSFHLQVSDPEDEICDWLDNNVDESTNKISAEMLGSWMRIDECAGLLSPEQGYFRFCPSNLAIEISLFKKQNGLEHVIPKSNVRDKLRSSCNPFELIGNAGFRSRITESSQSGLVDQVH